MSHNEDEIKPISSKAPKRHADDDNSDHDDRGDDVGTKSSEEHRKVFNERHKGSIPLESIMSCDDYQRRIILDGPKKKYAVSIQPSLLLSAFP